jgi:hypothetical protein
MDMRSFSIILALTVALLVSPAASTRVGAQLCDKYPSSACPAQGVVRGSSSYPCFSGWVKADWNTMVYRTRLQSSYAASGYEVNADIWCFAEAYEAEDYGFRRASN